MEPGPLAIENGPVGGEEIRILKYAFWGAENLGRKPPTTLGNVLLRHNLYDPAGIPVGNRFASYELNKALHHLLDAVDTDKDGVISEKEIHQVKLHLFGYSWGAAIAVALVRKLSVGGRLTLWNRGLPVKRYELKAPLPVAFLALVDPVPYGLGLVKRCIKMKCFPVLPPQIGTFINVYQTKGGAGTLRTNSPPYGPASGYHAIGTPLSRRLKGSALLRSESLGENEISEQVNITTDSAERVVLGSAFPGGSVMRLRGDEVNHDVIPFFAAESILKKLHR